MYNKRFLSEYKLAYLRFHSHRFHANKTLNKHSQMKAICIIFPFQKHKPHTKKSKLSTSSFYQHQSPLLSLVFFNSFQFKEWEFTRRLRYEGILSHSIRHENKINCQSPADEVKWVDEGRRRESKNIPSQVHLEWLPYLERNRFIG